MLEIASIAKSFRIGPAQVGALQGVDLKIEPGEFFILLGPSGCGKTTTLRAVAGLEQPDTGEISIDGTTVFSSVRRLFVPPEGRPIAMVFQSYAVWPHMDVYENIAFPLRRGVRSLNKRDIDTRVRSVLDLLGMEDLLDRPVTTLSGGQQQRVALARALALQPKVLLMDEPLSNLDLKLQVRLRSQIKDLMKRLGMTTLYVTHNQDEALEMGDRIAIMDRGRIVQMGSPVEIYRSPRSEFAARFMGEMNLIEGEVLAVNGATARVRTALGDLHGMLPPGVEFRPSDSCLLGIRPEDVELKPNTGTLGDNQVEGLVSDVRFLGEGFAYECRVQATTLRAKAHRSQLLQRGASVRISLDPSYCIVVPPSADTKAEEASLGLSSGPPLMQAAQ